MAEDKNPANAGEQVDPSLAGGTPPPAGEESKTSTDDKKKDAGTKTPGKSKEADKTPPTSEAKVKKVRVIVPEGTTLGRKLLTNGDITDDPDYLALLEVKGQKKVEAVK